MKIETVSIHNFRSIIDASFRLYDYTLLVGANNAGKTACMDAIRYFFDADKDSKFIDNVDYPKRGCAGDEESWVEITFGITDCERASLEEEYQTQSNKLTLRRYLKAGKQKKGFLFFKAADGTLADTPFYGSKKAQAGKIGKAIYIPAVSTVDEQAKLTGPSVLRDMVAEVFESAIQGSEAYTAFKKHVTEFSRQIGALQTTDKISLGTIEEDFNNTIKDWGTQFVLQLHAPSESEMVKNMLEWHLKDTVLGKENPIERYGSGFQRHFIYSLLTLKTRIDSIKSTSKESDTRKKVFTPDFTLLLFEEPEAFLHPQQQRELAWSLRAIGKKKSWQVLCSTHSPEFTSHNMNDLKTVIRLQKDVYETQVFQIGERDLKSLFAKNPFNAKKYPILAKTYSASLNPDMVSIKFAIWLDPHRAGMFFADKVLLVEGPSEQALIGRLMDDQRIPHPKGVFVLDCFGKYNLFRFMRLLTALGIRHSVLHDLDKSGDQKHAEWNRLTRDSRTSLTDEIEAISPDLEGFLQVQKPKDTHQKPQMLLWNYENGKMNKNKLTSFAELCRRLMSVHVVTKG